MKTWENKMDKLFPEYRMDIHLKSFIQELLDISNFKNND